MKKYAFGVDVGGTTVKLGLFTTDGTLLKDWEIPTRKEMDGSRILTDISASILDRMKEESIAQDAVEGIGIGLPGPVLSDGTILKAVNLGWGVFNVEKALNVLTGLKVRAGNDANVAALGEMWKGGGDGCPNMVMVTLGTGVGGGVILGGHILTGVNGSAGEIGHIPVVEPEEEKEACGCGKHGCLEQYCSATGAVTLARRYLLANPEAETILKNDGQLSAKDIFDAAKQADPVALEVTEQYYRILGKALAGISAVVNPQKYVIGGGVSKAGTILTENLKKYHQIYAFHAVRDVEFSLAVLGNQAGIYGAVKLLEE